LKYFEWVLYPDWDVKHQAEDKLHLSLVYEAPMDIWHSHMFLWIAHYKVLIWMWNQKFLQNI